MFETGTAEGRGAWLGPGSLQRGPVRVLPGGPTADVQAAPGAVAAGWGVRWPPR